MMGFYVFYSVLFKCRSVVPFRNYSTEINKCTKSFLHRGPPWKILFFGTDDFSLHSLKSLCAKLRTGTLIESLGIVTKGGSVVEKFGENEGLPRYIWPLKSIEIDNKYDIGMVVSFGKMIPNDILQAFPLGCINVHASILPRWRGAAPIVHAIMNGDTETGITIMKIHPHRFDVGEIVRQYRIPIESNETSLQLESKLAKYGSLLLMECLRDLPRCVEMAISQPNTGITYAPKIRSEMSLISWDIMSASKIYNLHRALNHIYPLTTRWHGSFVKLTEILLDEGKFKRKTPEIKEPIGSSDIHKSALAFLNSATDFDNSFSSLKFLPKDNRSMAGSLQFVKKKKELQVTCFDGNYIIIKKMKLSGKSMSALDFYNGFLIKRPKVEWIFGT